MSLLENHKLGKFYNGKEPTTPFGNMILSPYRHSIIFNSYDSFREHYYAEANNALINLLNSKYQNKEINPVFGLSLEQYINDIGVRVCLLQNFLDYVDGNKFAVLQPIIIDDNTANLDMAIYENNDNKYKRIGMLSQGILDQYNDIYTKIKDNNEFLEYDLLFENDHRSITAATYSMLIDDKNLYDNFLVHRVKDVPGYIEYEHKDYTKDMDMYDRANINKLTELSPYYNIIIDKLNQSGLYGS